MPGFAYQALNSSKGEIRLVKVQPVREVLRLESIAAWRDRDDFTIQDDYLSCNLTYTSLVEAPAYVALSYNWTSLSGPRTVLIDGFPYMVTANLDAALRHLTSQGEALNFWVDALCINQEDEAEKSEQVQQMREIYSKAVVVYAWLGPAAEDSDLAMEWIRHFGHLAGELKIGSEPTSQLRYFLELHDSAKTAEIGEKTVEFLDSLIESLSPANPESSKTSQALHDLFCRPYWQRVWVVQELFVARSITFVCGLSAVTESDLHYGLRLLRNYRQHQLMSRKLQKSTGPDDILIQIKTSNPINLLKVRRAQKELPLAYLLRSLFHFESSIRRDKIFALLGISSDAQKLGLIADYHKSFEKIYTHTATALILNGDTHILSLCDGQPFVPTMPSWVPDWSISDRVAPLQQYTSERGNGNTKYCLQPVFTAAGSLSPGPELLPSIEETSATLSLSAYRLGEICEAKMAWHSTRQWLTDLEELASKISSRLTMHGGLTETVIRTATADQTPRNGLYKPRLPAATVIEIQDAMKGDDLDQRISSLLQNYGLSSYCNEVQRLGDGRRPFLVANDYLAIGPHDAREGDSIFLFAGMSIPYVLRASEGDNTWSLVGSAYVHGVMDGEVIQKPHSFERLKIR